MNRSVFLLISCLLAAVVGCKSGPIGSRLFATQELTTFRTPQLRSQEVSEIAAQATGQDTPDQQQFVADLAKRLSAEEDPLVRETTLKAIAKFNTPLVGQVLVAGLRDSDPVVRQRCCRALGARRQEDSVSALRQVLTQDDELDVRHEATRALGQIGSSDALQALAVALQDHDPAMQLVGIEAARAATGQDFGNDANAYLAAVQGETPVVASRPESNSGVRRWLPF